MKQENELFLLNNRTTINIGGFYIKIDQENG